ncbi:aegerolysin Aa-Pri1 [Fusarium denticulatum]|uniref:Aegerolysin Aa-Pri1 n=1 Tax=Fusarium denticulatum TaxID=48507 RepID=A0A8H5U2I5_9HYPO|nr:aegerolysin Aa-Pri1 [Fusarium denticulatum]
MGNAQWISCLITNATGVELKINKASLSWGKFYSDPNNKNSEIPPSALEGVSIPIGGQYTFNSCGRNGTSSGTEGHVYLAVAGTQIVDIYWSVPWGSSSNIFTPTVTSGPYYANIVGTVPQDGPIGNIGCKVGAAAES